MRGIGGEFIKIISADRRLTLTERQITACFQDVASDFAVLVDALKNSHLVVKDDLMCIDNTCVKRQAKKLLPNVKTLNLPEIKAESNVTGQLARLWKKALKEDPLPEVPELDKEEREIVGYIAAFGSNHGDVTVIGLGDPNKPEFFNGGDLGDYMLCDFDGLNMPSCYKIYKKNDLPGGIESMVSDFMKSSEI